MRTEKVIRWPCRIPTLKTQRLLLQGITLEEAADYFKINCNKAVMESYGAKRHTRRQQTADLISFLQSEFEAKRMLRWGIFERRSNALIGDIGYWRFVHSRARGEIGMKLHPDFQGRGFMGEALDAVFKHSFGHLNMQSIEMNVEPENNAANSLCQRLGLTKVGIIPAHAYSDLTKSYIDTVCYSIAATQWAAQSS